MIRRPNLTFALSYFFVAVAALVLRKPVEPGGPLSAATAVAAAPAGRPSMPRPTPGTARRDGEDRFASLAAIEHAKPVATPRSPRRPTATFTRVTAVETVAAVAERVYGDPSYARELWLANRDSLKSPDGVVGETTLLRTPAIAARTAGLTVSPSAPGR